MSEKLPPPAYEPTDALPRTVGAIAAALTLLVALGIGAGIATVRREANGALLAAPASSFADGALNRPDVERAWEQCERDGTSHLAGYAWVDRRAGKVRIPLERAMDLVTDEAKGGGK